MLADLAKFVIRDLDRGMSFADMAEKHQVSIEQVRDVVDTVKLARESGTMVVMINSKDLNDFGVRLGLWAAAGAVVLAGYAMWWERGEDERKENRRYKKAVKERRRHEKLDNQSE